MKSTYMGGTIRGGPENKSNQDMLSLHSFQTDTYLVQWEGQGMPFYHTKPVMSVIVRAIRKIRLSLPIVGCP
jgi:hypothetical protein